jgi:hypothetical protein
MILLLLIRGRISIGVAIAHVAILKGGQHLRRPQEVAALLMLCGEGDERGVRV